MVALLTAEFWHTCPMQPDFATRLIRWQKRYGRHDLPWQTRSDNPDPYPIWLAEIMLQQTQVDTVIPYYQRFLERFPDLASLAAAPEDSVLGLWAGLGYYSRARNLHAAAGLIQQRHGGVFPRDAEAMQALPGIGRSTAAAIAAFAFGQRRSILDGNVKRVLSRVFGIPGWPGDKAVEARLWDLAEGLLPTRDLGAYTQGIMDLGATLCTRSQPQCPRCPFVDVCIAHRQGRQKELPAPRPKRPLPEKRTGMLVLLHAGEVLLQKRSSTGIWGGLWSLPECQDHEDPRKAAALLGFSALEARPLPAFTHGFTHFRLAIRPWCVQVSKPHRLESPGQIWMPLSELTGAALPAPVRRILTGVIAGG